MSATETRCSPTICADHVHATNGTNGSSTRALPAYSTPISWRAGARAVSSLLISAWPAFASAARNPNRMAGNGPPRWPRWMRHGIVVDAGLQTVPVSSPIVDERGRATSDRDDDRLHGTARSARAHGAVGGPEGLHLPQDHRRARCRPLGRGGHPGELLRRRGERVLHALSPVDRRPQRLPPREGRRRGDRQGAQRSGRRRRDPARTGRRGTRASTGTASSSEVQDFTAATYREQPQDAKDRARGHEGDVAPVPRPRRRPHLRPDVARQGAAR